MSWLAKSFANLIAANDDEDDDEQSEEFNRSSIAEVEVSSSPTESDLEEGNLGKGVKEDISELSKALTRQIWGVASFLAPPPTSSTDDSQSDSVDREVVDQSPSIGGIRSDFAEIGGRFRSGISILSGTKAVSEISKIASSFLQLGAEAEDDLENEQELESRSDSGGIGAIGVTEEVLTFARNISLHPETWLDFPLFSDEELPDDFDMSDAQQEHALAVERLVPRLAALRIELCPGHISEGTFWKIYFVLLHPRLNKQDAELLSTPQIVEARALLLQDLQTRTKSSPRDWPSAAPAKETETESEEEDESGGDVETDKYPVATAEVRIIDKAVIDEDIVHVKAEKVEEVTISAAAAAVVAVIAEDEDVSFSDLEDDDELRPGVPPTSASPAKSTPEVNEWSDLDDLDVA
ncbi:uncharacterized protein LOC144707574 isoform X2 [Wolffia australiana]